MQDRGDGHEAADGRDAAGAALLASLEAHAARLALTEVGRSTEGRPLWGRRWDAAEASGGAPLVVLGGIHGDEPASVTAALGLAELLERHGPPANMPVVLLPAVNPDGLARQHKNSARDVDLNRNFPARNFPADHGRPHRGEPPPYRPGYFPGPAPLSEPETRAIARLIQSERVRGVVAVHSPLACINYDGPAASWAGAVAAACGWPARADIGYPTPGSLGSWLGVDEGLPVLTVELPPGDYAQFQSEAEAALWTAVTTAATVLPR